MQLPIPMHSVTVDGITDPRPGLRIIGGHVGSYGHHHVSMYDAVLLLYPSLDKLSMRLILLLPSISALHHALVDLLSPIMILSESQAT